MSGIIQVCMTKYPLDAIKHHEVIGLAHIMEGALVMHIASIVILATMYVHAFVYTSVCL